MMPSGQSDYFAKTLEKGIRLLNLFNENQSSWSLSEIAVQMDLNMTSVYRLANTFLELGYLQRGKRSKRLRLGPMAVTLGHQLLRGFDTNRLIQPLVDRIHSRHNISIDVSLYHAGRLVQIYKRETDNTLTYRQDTVSELLYCTASGKSVLAFLSPEELKKLLLYQPLTRRSDNTITEVDDLYAELERVRQTGYARNNEEYIKGLIAIAMPLLSKTTGQPLGALSFTSTTLDHKLSEFESKYAGILRDLARQLSEIIPDV
jgi:IclR family transcriptional regulator, pca regulon regulatory protein